MVISQDCIDDDYTMQVGLSVWTSGINGCEDGIDFLENAGYPCNTSLSTLNNPFWGSNPNETLANICGCTCEEKTPNYCEDPNACNYGEIGECEYADPYYVDCDGVCINDFDQDGICDELETNPCEQYPNPGPCFAAITVYFFNQQTSQCEETTWGGCDGVVPFWTLQECENECKNNSSNEELYSNKLLIKTINILAKESISIGFVIELFEDGSVKKKYKTK